MDLRVKRLDTQAILPTQGSKDSACYDVYSIKKYQFCPHESHNVRTGLAFQVPPGFMMDIRPRSGLASRGLIVLNSPGVLDSDYRGELQIIMRNISNRNITVLPGDRVAQIKIDKLVDVEWEEVEELNTTERGEKGFGSTGR